jgi:hypothetical protein
LKNAEGEGQGENKMNSDNQHTIFLYNQAKNRVMINSTLASHADFILADWPEGDEHWRWVISAPIDEILDWVKSNK